MNASAWQATITHAGETGQINRRPPTSPKWRESVTVVTSVGDGAAFAELLEWLEEWQTVRWVESEWMEPGCGEIAGGRRGGDWWARYR